jgi:hypothetical protein
MARRWNVLLIVIVALSLVTLGTIAALAEEVAEPEENDVCVRGTIRPGSYSDCIGLVCHPWTVEIQFLDGEEVQQTMTGDVSDAGTFAVSLEDLPEVEDPRIAVKIDGNWVYSSYYSETIPEAGAEYLDFGAIYMGREH